MFGDILKKSKKTTSSWNAEFIFVYLPCYERYLNDINHDEFLQKRNSLFG